jgi:hypothetical protein
VIFSGSKAGWRIAIFHWTIVPWPKCHGLLLLGISLVVFFGCNQSARVREGVMLEASVQPQPPLIGQATIDLQLKDAAGRPIPKARITLEGNMTHPGMAPVFAEAKETAAGNYSCPLKFSMAGDWFVTARITLSDGQKLERNFSVKGVRPN